MSTADRVQEFLTSEMLRGALQPGSWLRQDELAERLEVSKIPVREALQRLAAIGLLRFEPNRGVIVPRLSVDDAEEHFELRRAVEPRLLARDPEAHDRRSRRGRDGARCRCRRHHRGELALPPRAVRGIGLVARLDLVATLHIAVAPYVLLYTKGLGGAGVSDAQHVAILEACRAADADTAIALLHTHLDDAERSLRSYLAHEEAAT